MPYDESQPEPSTEPDTPNSTTFYGSDSSANYDGKYRADGTETFQDHYRRLSIYNTGIWTRNWADKEALRRADNLAVFDSISSRLELTDYQTTIARQQFDELNLQELSSPQGIDATLVAIMTCAVACRQDGRFYHPAKDDNLNDSLFTSLISNLGYRDSVVHSCYGKVLNRVTLL
jgi:hypothetical protein